MSIENTLAERGNRYGDFTDHADLAQGIQFRMQKFCLKADNDVGFIEPWKDRLNNVQRQALTVIADKIARILSGDPNYADNWHDIQGYAKLVEDRLPKPAEAALPADTGCPHCGVGEGALHVNCPTQQVVTVNLGTSLSPPIDPANVDISDAGAHSDLPPGEWRAGDVVVALHNCDGQFSRLKRYTLRSANELQIVNVVADDRGDENGWGEHNFRFHSRPTK